MAQWTSAAAQVRALAKAVSAAFAASALTDEEKNPGKIEITDLPWQAPPLVAPQMLDGAPLQDYLDIPIPLDEKTIHTFWTKTLEQMWFTPGRLLRRGVLANCGVHMPKVKLGQRAMRFAIPGGYPTFLDENAGALFSLEVAHAAMTSLPISNLVSDDDNYYVELFGQTLGVKDGKPACVTPWTYDVSGQVQDLLAMPRGNTDYTCRFDQIALVRSVLHVNRSRFPRNFDALDLALQSLRLLALDGNCPALVQEMYKAPLDMMVVREQERALREAIELMPDPMSDRSKLHALHALLVPSVIAMSRFKQNIFSGENYPFTLAAGKLDSIEAWLNQEYNARIPLEMRQLRGRK